MAPVFLRRRQGAQQRDHVVGLMRVAGPDLAPVDEPSPVGLGRAGRGGKNIRSRIRLTEADRKAQLTARDLRQDLLFYLFLAVTQDNRAALPVGRRVGAGGCARRQHLLGDDVTLEMRALVAAVLLGPSHPDPALGANLAAKLTRERPLTA